MIDLLMRKYQDSMQPAPKEAFKALIEQIKQKAMEKAAKNREYQAAVLRSNYPGKY